MTGLRKSLSIEASNVGETGGVRYASFRGVFFIMRPRFDDGNRGGDREPLHRGDDADELVLDNTGLKRDGLPFPVASNCHVSHALRHVLHPFCSTGFTCSEYPIFFNHSRSNTLISVRAIPLISDQLVFVNVLSSRNLLARTSDMVRYS